MKALTPLLLALVLLDCGRSAPYSNETFGSQVTSTGTSFRVWAPHATAVFVEGDFNGWSTSANPLAPQGNGVFSSEVPGVAAGAHYKYLLETPQGNLVRNDPRALEVTPDLSQSIVYDPAAFVWSD